jgi:hypothetical protein
VGSACVTLPTTTTTPTTPTTITPAQASTAAAGRRCLSTSAPAHNAAEGCSDPGSSPPPKPSWLPAWARARLPAALGGEPALEDLTLDSYLTQISRARTLAAMGSAIGGAGRASADPQAQGNLRLYENIIGAMDPAHRADPASFDAPSRAAVAASAGVSVAQVDDCMAKFDWTREMMRVLAARKAAGQPMPASVTELEAVMGDWRAKRRAGGGGAAAAPASASAPGSCPFQGRPTPGRNAVCGKTGKKFKNCCARAG